MKEKKKNQCRSDKNPRSYGVVPTRQAEGEDFFYYIGKDDEFQAFNIEKKNGSYKMYGRGITKVNPNSAAAIRCAKLRRQVCRDAFRYRKHSVADLSRVFIHGFFDLFFFK